MKTFAFTLTLALALQLTANAQTMKPKELAAAWDADHVSRIPPSNVRHSDLKDYLKELGQLGLTINEVGRSYGEREIYQIEWGKGPLKVFLWSQMHGDEPTATSAMIDILAYLRKHPEDAWVKKIHDSITIRYVPMLNPDGTEFFQRRNIQGIDINRDAVGLKTPEGQLLKKLRDGWKPDIGFNLHNQGQLTTAGNIPRQASISFLAVLGDPKGVSTPGFEKNKRIISAMIGSLNEFIPGNIARYDDTYNGAAFGDNFSAWGTPVILIETGGLHEKDELYLVKMNFIAIGTALDVIAGKNDADFQAAVYEQLPMNDSGRLMDVIFRNVTIIASEAPNKSFTADVGLNRERRRASFSAQTFIRDIGSLSDNTGLTEYDASDFYVVHRSGSIRVGESGELLFYRKTRKIDRRTPVLERSATPDAVFSLGGWLTGAELMAEKQLKGKPSN